MPRDVAAEQTIRKKNRALVRPCNRLSGLVVW